MRFNVSLYGRTDPLRIASGVYTGEGQDTPRATAKKAIDAAFDRLRIQGHDPSEIEHIVIALLPE